MPNEIKNERNFIASGGIRIGEDHSNTLGGIREAKVLSSRKGHLNVQSAGTIAR